DALDIMKRYRWPGNVRELENLIRRLTALYPQDRITAALLDSELNTPVIQNTATDSEDNVDIGSAVENHLNRYFSEFGSDLPPPGLYHRVLREVELPLISGALAATRGNQIRASELLGLNRNTLRKKIRDLDIPVIRGQR
ncbi:MAG TPA: helix-turn-helix domain-containing protein, partial [Afifellaceae bacterium]|nr:helix-turn-helix domain-containing protein [Afifellaceae bacterium]